ncbi:hypothetical protein ACLD0W_11095 [Alloalcanivorax sp. C16-1]|uniref:hypothetical protein n=1 Tax=Alloalcanivorax sp. C16-1 TaxID=3390051 RepID=UPI003970A8CE
MKDAFSRRAALPLILSAAIGAAPASADIRLDEPSAELTLQQAEAGYRIQSFDITALPGNRWALVWAARGEDANARDYVAAQRFNAAGEPVGAPVRVHQVAEGESLHLGRPSVDSDGNGNLMVSWGSYDPEGGGSDEYCYEEGWYTRVNRNDTGQTVAAPRSIPAPGIPACRSDIVVDADGDYVTASSLGSEGYLFWVRYLRDHTQTWADEVSAFRNIVPGGMTMAPDGTLVVTIEDRAEALFRRLSPGGIALHDDHFEELDNGVASSSDVYQSVPAVASVGGDGFVGVWLEDNTPGDDPQKTFEIHGRRWHGDGTAGAALLLASNPQTGTFTPPSVAADGQGNMVGVWAWQEDGQAPVAGLTAYDRDGQLVGDRDTPFADLSALGEFTPGGEPRVILQEGVMAVAWQTDDGSEIQGRTFIQHNAPESNEGGGGGGGPMAPLLLLTLAVLGLRRRRFTPR